MAFPVYSKHRLNKLRWNLFGLIAYQKTEVQITAIL